MYLGEPSGNPQLDTRMISRSCISRVFPSASVFVSIAFAIFKGTYHTTSYSRDRRKSNINIEACPFFPFIVIQSSALPSSLIVFLPSLAKSPPVLPLRGTAVYSLLPNSIPGIEGFSLSVSLTLSLSVSLSFSYSNPDFYVFISHAHFPRTCVLQPNPNPSTARRPVPATLGLNPIKKYNCASRWLHGRAW
jgi:hypothetical protein